MKTQELYLFTQGDETWSYTSGDTPFTYDLIEYQPAVLGRGKTQAKNELSKSNLKVTLSLDDPLAQSLLLRFTTKLLSLTLYVHNYEDASTVVEWKGRLSSQEPSKDSLRMSFESIFTSMRRPGLRARFQKTCRHVLYSRGCNLDFDDFASSVLVSDVQNKTLTIAEAANEADEYYAGGVIRTTTGLLGFIVSHSGNQIVLQDPIDELTQEFTDTYGYGTSYGTSYGGLSVLLAPGCDRLRQTCLNKFDNLNNFGGFPWIPAKNPMDGTSLT